MIRQSYQLLGFLFLAVITTLYYGLGAEQFPDYDNYITIANNNGWLFNEDEYLFEWISRALLTLPMSLGLQPRTAVDLLALINQIVCLGYFGWLLISQDRARVFGATLLIALVGVLLITTTLRASTAYLALSLFVLRGMRLDVFGGLLLLLGLAWHDSFAVPLALVLLAHLSLQLQDAITVQKPATGRLKASSALECLAVVIAFAVLLLAAPLRDAILAALNIDPGIRSVYLDSDGSHSLIKLAYCGICLLMCLATVCDPQIPRPVRRFSALLALAVSFTYLVSGVVAVRLAVFAFCALVPFRGVFVLNAERSDVARVVLLLLTPVLLWLSVADILGQTL